MHVQEFFFFYKVSFSARQQSGSLTLNSFYWFSFKLTSWAAQSNSNVLKLFLHKLGQNKSILPLKRTNTGLTETAKFMIVYKQVSRTITLSVIGQATDSPTPNSRHWLSQCCYAGWSECSNKHNNDLEALQGHNVYTVQGDFADE